MTRPAHVDCPACPRCLRDAVAYRSQPKHEAETLRDQFAMAALAHVSYCPIPDLDVPGERELDHARACYRIADAMLIARVRERL